MGRPTREEIETVVCSLYELCPSPNCHVAPETVRRVARLPGDRFSKVWDWLQKKGFIWCKSHGHSESCGPTKKLIEAAKRRCRELWEQL